MGYYDQEYAFTEKKRFNENKELLIKSIEELEYPRDANTVKVLRCALENIDDTYAMQKLISEIC